MRSNYGLYALALAITVVGALAVGVPAGAISAVAIVLLCPLMMFLVMRGMHGGHGGDGNRS
jgi:hypothetical protein